ncbi:MAG: zf-HC2 domain-containing protein [Deltaproteobacteria bacterium]|nr:zf-HC2 domain-containing protein [Deltaproteobacteria bacterium]
MMQTCKNFEQDLVLYYYGECEGEDRNKVAAHLIVCRSCRRFLQELSAMLQVAAKTDEPSAAFWESYSREMRYKLADLEDERSWLGAFFAWFPVWRPAWAAVVAFLLVVSFAGAVWHSKEHPANQKLAEIAVIEQNMEFFRTMDLLSAVDFLEALDGKG